MSRYVGWGGLADAFDESKSNWANEYLELKSLLSEEEYKSARESTLTSFYTSPVVIESIYKALNNLGFRHGNILEIIIPSLIQGMGKIKKCAPCGVKSALGCVDRPGHPGYFILPFK